MHSKDVLAEFIYKLHQTNGFSCGSTLWSAPAVGFSYNNSLPSKFMKNLRDNKLISEGKNAAICVLADWETVAEGIIFTDRAIYVNSPKNEDKQFKARYDDITDLIYLSDTPKLGIETKRGYYSITTKLWSKRNIYDFLQFASGKYEFVGAIDENN